MRKDFATNKHERTRKKSKNFFVRFRVCSWLILFSVSLFFFACTQKMADQPYIKPLGTSPVFPNNQAARHPVYGTIPSGFTRVNRRVNVDKNFDKNADAPPFPVTLQFLERGRERYEIYCAVCHGLTGEGDGMIVRRGFSRPPSYHTEMLRNAPLGHFYDVMTNGFGAMASYANQVEPNDRWAIAAYIRALQLSQNANASDVPPEKIGELEKGK